MFWFLYENSCKDMSLGRFIKNYKRTPLLGKVSAACFLHLGKGAGFQGWLPMNPGGLHLQIPASGTSTGRAAPFCKNEKICCSTEVYRTERWTSMK